MAGIGFELRKLFVKEGMFGQLQAYTYSSVATVGPMIVCIILVLGLQKLMAHFGAVYTSWELFIGTITYIFIFSIVLTSGISLIITRYLSDILYKKEYSRILSSYYGVTTITLPLVSIIACLFLYQVETNLAYKVNAYFIFILLVIIWLQAVYLSALKDYIRVSKGFALGVTFALLTGWGLMKYTSIDELLCALFAINVGFFLIVVLNELHFRSTFLAAESIYFYEFLKYFIKFKRLFFTGIFAYSGVYLHNFVYWFSEDGQRIASVFRVYMHYDVPVFFSYMTVIPSLVFFIVIVETRFFEKIKTYYDNVLSKGTVQDILTSRIQLQNTLIREISLLMEIQLLFTVLFIAAGIMLLPSIGFTMLQLELFMILTLSYYLFIIFYSVLHILMYFDDQKGVFYNAVLFFVLNIGLTIVTKHYHYDGLGFFLASLVALIVVMLRLANYIKNIDYYTFCTQPLFNKETSMLKRRKIVK